MRTARPLQTGQPHPHTQATCAFAVAFEPADSRVEHMRRITKAELVTNAIQHGEGAVELRVEVRPCELRIAVTDGSHQKPVLRNAADGEEGGRGLQLVDAFAKEWGTSGDGRTIWCTLSLTPDGA
ncbi:ATP-binding protein [Streptomyces sp. NPDC057638]|uniref:ATP-binding protein n=1 Tax=Streptomyces sp. NPDC057638 TaxID=3346190 RepID=UPI0036B3C30A